MNCARWLTCVGLLVMTSVAQAQLTSSLEVYFDFDGSLANRAAAIGGPASLGVGNAVYAGTGSGRFLGLDTVPDTESQFPIGFSGLTGDAIYLGGDNGDADHYTVPGLMLGTADFTINLYAAMGEDQSAGNSGDETTGGNGPSIFGNKAASFVDSDTSDVVGVGSTGFAYGVWSSDGDDYTATVSDGAGNNVVFGDQDVSFDAYSMFSLVYDSAANELRRYQDGALADTVDTTGFGSFDSGTALRLGGFPEGSTAGSDTFWGAIDDVAVWSRALSSGELATVAQYGSFGFDLEDAINGVPLPVDDFTGASTFDNLASNGDNWSGGGPGTWSTATQVTIASGTTDTFSGVGTGPAIFDSNMGPVEVGFTTIGADGETTFVEMSGTASIIGTAATDSTIGPSGSTVNMVMSGNSVFDHRDSAEEDSELDIAKGGSTVSIEMNDNAEMTSGTRVADAAYATGFRRPQAADGIDRVGDDIKFGNGGNFDITMNGDSLIYTPDVFYPNDSSDGATNVVQNDNSQVIVGWDTRFFDTSDHTSEQVINWTMNDSSKFLVARDHALGETAGDGVVNLTINDSAEFRAGDRIVLGAGGGNVNVVLNDGLMKVGGDSPSDVIFVDDTGEVPVGSESVARDWFLYMGGGANASLTANGGRVEIGRSAYIGRGGGNAEVLIDGAAFDVLGVAPSGEGLGNTPGGGVPGDTVWAGSGGDLFVGWSSGDNGSVTVRSGSLDVARDLIVSFGNGLGEGGDGKFALASSAATESGAVNVGGDLVFGGDNIGLIGSNGTSEFQLIVDGSFIDPVEVNGNMFIFNDGNTVSNFSLDIEGNIDPGMYTLVNHSGYGSGGIGDDMFTELDIPGVEYDLVYNPNSLMLNIITFDPVIVTGDFDGDGDYACADIDALVAEIVAGTNDATFDLTGDGSVDDADLQAWLAEAGDAELASGNPYLAGDANLDGVVDGQDFVAWNANKFSSTAAWCSGDFNADGVVDGQDFISWNANKFTSADGFAVPEPATGTLILLCLGVASVFRRRR